MKIHINLALILIEDRPAKCLGERFGVLAKCKQPARDVPLTFASPASVVIRHATQMCLHRIGLSAKAATISIVSKRLAAPYGSGHCKSWIKVSNPKLPAYMRIIDGTF